MTNQKQQEMIMLPAYAPLLYSDKTYFVVTGGRNSGKSFNMALYYLIKFISPEYFRGVIARYQKNNLRFGIGQEILDMIDRMGIKHLCEFGSDEITYKPNGNKIISHSFKITDHAQVAKSKGLANNTHLLIDEAQELGEVPQGEEEYQKAIDSFRSPDADTQIIVLMNPTTKFSWMFERWWLEQGVPNPRWKEDHCFIHTTYLDNVHPETKEPLYGRFKKQKDGTLVNLKLEEYKRVQLHEPKRYKYDLLGHWSDGEDGRIFEDWSFHYEPDPEAEVIYGLDFGFSGDPAACVEVRKRNGKIWLKEILYERNLTNEDLFDVLREKGVPLDGQLIADSAEPKTIETLRRLGMRNIKGAYKGPDSIRSGVQKIKGYEVFVDPSNCKNLKEEYQKYVWKRGTGKPMDQYNHLMDALRYALSIETNKPVTMYRPGAQKKAPYGFSKD